MFKFFRQYNKYLLAGGVAVLMIVFLIQVPGTNILSPRAGAGEWGRTPNRKIVGQDVQQANAEISIIEKVVPGGIDLEPGINPASWAQTLLLGNTSPQEQERQRARRDGLRWVLMLDDAEHMGLTASDTDVAMMRQVLKIETPEKLTEFAEARGLGPDSILIALRDWAIVQQYQDVICGFTPVAPAARVALIGQIMEYMQLLGPSIKDDPSILSRLLQGFAMAPARVTDQVRISAPLAEHFLYEEQARIKAAIQVVPARDFVNDEKEPDTATLEQLFNTYKNDLPGTAPGSSTPGPAPGDSKPYGFGYFFPNRFQVEYLEVPFDRALEAAQVREADAIKFYQQNRENFKEPPPVPPVPPATTEPSTQPSTQPATQAAEKTRSADAAATTQPDRYKPYVEVRSEILTYLREQQARDLCDKVISAAGTQLQEAEGRLGKAGGEGYLDLPSTWMTEPALQMETVAREVAQDPDLKGIQPTYRRSDQWLDERQIETILAGAGQTELKRLLESRLIIAQGRMASFADYALSAREFKPDANNPLLAKRLQKGVASQIMHEYDGSTIIFRLREADAAHAPKQLADVQEQVVRDAKLLSAYEKIKAQKATWLQRVQSEPLDTLGKKYGLSSPVYRPDPFPRRVPRPGGGLQAPDLPGIGASAPLADGLFNLAEGFASPEALESAAPAQRSLAVTDDSKLALFLAQVDKFQPISRSEYRRELNSARGLLPFELARSMDLAPAVAETLSIKAIEKRVGFKPVKSRGPETQVDE